MAVPRVFVSSTCYDLSEVRIQLEAFIKSYGFDPCLSENGDVYYHPDLHTHDSCIEEVSNCQIFILIIGGRFGGKYKADPEKSIVNAEYSAAKQLSIPVFTLIKSDVLNDHAHYQLNRDKKNIDQIEYRSIEKQEHVKHIRVLQRSTLSRSE